MRTDRPPGPIRSASRSPIAIARRTVRVEHPSSRATSATVYNRSSSRRPVGPLLFILHLALCSLIHGQRVPCRLPREQPREGLQARMHILGRGVAPGRMRGRAVHGPTEPDRTRAEKMVLSEKCGYQNPSAAHARPAQSVTQSPQRKRPDDRNR